MVDFVTHVLFLIHRLPVKLLIHVLLIHGLLIHGLLIHCLLVHCLLVHGMPLLMELLIFLQTLKLRRLGIL